MRVALVESERLESILMTSPAGQLPEAEADGFARLLERLHPDADEAAGAYERLRAKLVRFFDWRGLPMPDDCADEVLDRLARRLHETAIDDVQKYSYGIARLVALEQQRAPAFAPLDENLTLAASAPPDDVEGTTALQDCFDRCLAGLPEENRRLLLRYYDGERASKIANRRSIASMLGVTHTALRNRVQRLRDSLERCVQACAASVVQPGGVRS